MTIEGRTRKFESTRLRHTSVSLCFFLFDFIIELIKQEHAAHLMLHYNFHEIVAIVNWLELKSKFDHYLLVMKKTASSFINCKGG